MPQTSSADDAQCASCNLIDALSNPLPAAPFVTLGQDQLRAIRQLATIFDSVSGPWSPWLFHSSYQPHAHPWRWCAWGW